MSPTKNAIVRPHILSDTLAVFMQLSDPFWSDNCYYAAMGAEGLTTYVRYDYSANTDTSVLASRVNKPRGCLIHTTSGSNSLQWLQGGSTRAGRSASADALINRAGAQYLICPPYFYPYHAGVSTFTAEREYRGNEVSELLIGIELECLDTEQPTFEQYDSLADLITYYAGFWSWAWPFILLGHYGVARPLGRRSDPVSFDWGTLMGRLYVRTVQARIPGI